MRQEIMGCGKVVASSEPYANNPLQTDNHTNTSSLSFSYRLEPLDALPDAQPIVSKH